MPLRRIRSTASFILPVLLLLSVLIPAGCALKVSPEPAWEKNAVELLDQAEALFSKKQYDQSLKTVDAFLSRYPESRHRDRAFYLQGEVRFTQRDYTRALSYYKEIIEKFPSSSFIIQARYKLGLCYFELKEYDLAIANLENRSKITDPAQLRRIAEVLSVSYLTKKNFLPAVKEIIWLAETAQNERQKAGYRDRIRELIDKNLTEQELRTLSDGSNYPSDISRLRLAALLIEQRSFREAVSVSKGFLEKFPAHPERMRAEMLLNEATSRLSSPKYYLAALVPQSGQLAFFGDRVLKGIQLAVHTYNLQVPDERVELLVKDTEGSPEKAVAALTELASKDIVAAIGPLLTKEAEALVPSLEKLKVPVITPAASGEGIGTISPWLFRNALTNSIQATAAARFALGLNLKKFVIIHPDDAYGRDLARLFTRELQHKAEILATIAYPPDVKDFGPYARKLLEIDLRSRKIAIPEDDQEKKKLFNEYMPSFDALYLPGHAEKVGLLIPQLAFYNIKGITTIGSNDWHSPDLIERADRYAEGAVFIDGFFPESMDPVIKPVIEAYRSAYQEEPDILAAQAYDAAMMVLSLLKEHKDTPRAIRDALLSMKDYPGISGTITFPGNGEAQKKLFIIKIQDGKFAPYTSGK
jgi:ABC-type branched-subunit amino acid transport system substrate-binding protein/outer membrane protein assembly factor BamD (BamD/ComL family)